jgi:hypothetical protein
MSQRQATELPSETQADKDLLAVLFRSGLQVVVKDAELRGSKVVAQSAANLEAFVSWRPTTRRLHEAARDQVTVQRVEQAELGATPQADANERVLAGHRDIQMESGRQGTARPREHGLILAGDHETRPGFSKLRTGAQRGAVAKMKAAFVGNCPTKTREEPDTGSRRLIMHFDGDRSLITTQKRRSSSKLPPMSMHPELPASKPPCRKNE